MTSLRERGELTLSQSRSTCNLRLDPLQSGTVKAVPDGRSATRCREWLGQKRFQQRPPFMALHRHRHISP